MKENKYTLTYLKQYSKAMLTIQYYGNDPILLRIKKEEETIIKKKGTNNEGLKVIHTSRNKFFLKKDQLQQKQ